MRPAGKTTCAFILGALLLGPSACGSSGDGASDDSGGQPPSEGAGGETDGAGGEGSHQGGSVGGGTSGGMPGSGSGVGSGGDTGGSGASGSGAGSSLDPPPGYELVWADEFDGEGPPSTDDWSYESGFVRNEEHQWYQTDNVWQEDGLLIIEARREQVPNPGYDPSSASWKASREFAEYTSSSIHTQGKQSFQYGRFEMRARFAAATGLWPAFWTLGTSGPWPQNGEIDILEYYADAVHASVATGTESQWVARWDTTSVPVSTLGDETWDSQFHVWRLDWDEELLSISVDGEVLNESRLDDMTNPDGGSPFKQPHYILLSFGVGGTSAGDPTDTPFPTRYEIDYVRVFQVKADG